MERKKQYKGSGWECCYANNIFGTLGVEMRASGQKLVKFCTLTHAAKLVVDMYSYIEYTKHWHRSTEVCTPSCETITMSVVKEFNNKIIM